MEIIKKNAEETTKEATTETAHVEHKHTVHIKIPKLQLQQWKPYIQVSIIYLLIALTAFAFVTANMYTTTTGIGGDAYLNLWDIWWVNYATFTLHGSIWATSAVFWPVGENLVFHTLAPLAGFLAVPFTFVSVPFAYDSIFFIGFMLSGLTMYILADYVLDNKYAAFIAGLIFSFSASHIDHSYGLLIFTQIEWIPLALYFFMRMMKDKKWIYGAGLGIAFTLATFMGNIEQSIMLIILLFVVLVLYVINKSTRPLVLSQSFVMNIAVAIVIGFIVGFWGYIPLINTVLQPGNLTLANSNNTAQYNMLWSADILTFFVPSYYNSIFYPALANSSLYLPDPAERIAYMGYVAIALSLLALWKNFKSTRLWLGIVVVFASLSLGPSILVNGFATGIPTLYNLYHAIPAFSVIREPGRFSLITALGLAMLAAIGAKYLLENFKTNMDKRKFAIVVCFAVAFLYMFEANGLVLAGPVTSAVTTYVSVPSLYASLATLGGNFSTLTLPALPSAGVTPDLYPGQATYYQAFSHRPIVGGLDGRQNTSQLLSLYNIPLVIVSQELELNYTPTYESPIRENYTNQTLLSLYSYSTAVLIVDKTAFSPMAQNSLLNYLGLLFGNPLYNSNSTVAFVTTNAINNKVFRSFVSYPSLENWQQTSIFINGTNSTVWVPTYPGAVQVYAPYADTVDINNEIASRQLYYVNATVSFQALAAGSGTTLEIGTLSSLGAFSPIVSFNLTNKLASYRFNTSLLSGPIGSTLLFLVRNSTSTFAQLPQVALANITFSRR